MDGERRFQHTGSRAASAVSDPGVGPQMINWGQMPIFIARGRDTLDAMRGMLAKPEDRAEAVVRESGWQAYRRRHDLW
jgi:hypothetical protein